MTEDTWKVSQSDIDKVGAFLQELAPSIYDGGFSNDMVLCRMMAVEMKMKQNYLLLLADMFMRQHILHHFETAHASAEEKKEEDAANGNYTVEWWGNHNEHIRELKNMTGLNMKKLKLGPNKVGADKKDTSATIDTPGDLVANAVKSYFHRVAPRLMLNQPAKIKGDLRTVALYIASTVDFVSNLANSADATCPFQYDSGAFMRGDQCT